jgi:hypothetical protein
MNEAHGGACRISERLHDRQAPRRRALPKTQGDDRACVRQHEVQPPDRPLSTARAIRRALRMAINYRRTQPPEAPQAPNSRRGGVRTPETAGDPKSRRRNHQCAAAATASHRICATATTNSTRPTASARRPQVESRHIALLLGRFDKPETGLEPVTPCLQGDPGGSPRERMNTRGYWGFGSLDRSGSAVLLPWFTVDFRELRQDCQNPGESA